MLLNPDEVDAAASGPGDAPYTLNPFQTRDPEP
jgi:hypothetical protein